jgi:hypothetical protein
LCARLHQQTYFIVRYDGAFWNCCLIYWLSYSFCSSSFFLFFYLFYLFFYLRLEYSQSLQLLNSQVRSEGFSIYDKQEEPQETKAPKRMPIRRWFSQFFTHFAHS